MVLTLGAGFCLCAVLLHLVELVLSSPKRRAYIVEPVCVLQISELHKLL